MSYLVAQQKFAECANRVGTPIAIQIGQMSPEKIHHEHHFPTPIRVGWVKVEPVDGDVSFRIKELEPLTF